MAKQRALLNTIMNLQVILIKGKFLGQFMAYELLKKEHVP
jgi:hypothetical protein